MPGVIRLRCPKCDAVSEFELPLISDPEGQIVFFGDEAEQRIGNDGVIYVYVLMAFATGFPSLAAELMRDAKLKLRPGVDPASWSWHTYDLRDKRWRAKNGVTLAHWEVDEVVSGLCTFLGANEPNRIVSATVLPPSQTPYTSDELFERVLTAAIFSTTQLATSMRYAPRFVLEARTSDHDKGMIDYAVEKIGRGLRHSLPYIYVSRGLTHSIPVTEPKGRLELEYADVAAFIIRRALLRDHTDRPIEFPVDALGEVHWTMMDTLGIRRVAARGFPR
ncbi:MAG: hypothetical protein H7Y62_03070 [Hyphomicrobium sp.]|nr:hypothetical protein [Hyphomicrobium sp.]